MRILKDRFVLDQADSSIPSKLALKVYVSQEESNAILEVSALRQPCRKATLDAFAKVHPAYVTALAGMFADGDADWVRESWLGKLRDDKRLVVHAAEAAQKAADFIMGKQAPVSDGD